VWCGGFCAELCAKCSAIIFIICSAVLLVACCVWLATSVIKNYCLPAGKYLGCWVSLFIFCFPFASLCLYGCVLNTRPNGVRCKCAEYLGDFFSLSLLLLPAPLTHASRNGSGVVCYLFPFLCFAPFSRVCSGSNFNSAARGAVLRNVLQMEM
jgi:hypothetical protein